MILPASLGENLMNGHVENAVVFISTPTSYVPQLYKNQITAAIFSEYVPYMTAASLAHTEISRDEVVTAYSAMMENGLLFSFRLEEASSSHGKEADFTLSLSISALLFFTITFHTVSALFSANLSEISARIGGRHTRAALILPHCCVQLVFLITAAAAGCILYNRQTGKNMWGVFFALCIYSLLILSFSLFICRFLTRKQWIYSLSFFILLFSVILLPIFTDAALFLPLIRYVRLFLPPCWLFICFQYPLPTAVLALTLFPLAAAGIAPSSSKR